ncbi:hypothetical protein ER45_029290 (plasmid) [Bacillus mycoides]|nr:hypothetical protein ER45_029290 [Bacillus mycoides]
MQLKSVYKVLATTAIFGQTMVAPILSHADTIATKNEFQITKQNNATDNRFGSINLIFGSGVEEYGDKSKEEAKKGIEGKLEEQEKKLSSVEKGAIKDFITKDNKSINDYLLKTDGKVTDPDRQKEIDKLDGILNKLRTDKTIKVYQSLSTTTEEQAANLKGQISVNSKYEITSLTRPSGSDPLLEITVPKESHAAYEIVNDSAGLITERGTGLKITNVRTFNDRGAPRIKIEATLLSSKEMKERQSKLNEVSKSLSDTMKLPVSLQLSGVETAASIEKARTAITEASTDLENINKIVPTLNMPELFKKLAADGGHIILKDSPLIDEHGKAYDDAAGTYDYSSRGMQLDLNLANKNTTLHQLGHAVDYRIPFDPNLKKIESEELQVFLRSFGMEWEPKLVDHYNNPREYWAEAFARFITDNKKLKESAPKTYQYIEDKLKLISSEEMKGQSELNEVSKSLSDTMKLPVSLQVIAGSGIDAKTLDYTKSSLMNTSRRIITETSKNFENINTIIPSFNGAYLLKKLAAGGVYITLQNKPIPAEKNGRKFSSKGIYTSDSKELKLNANDMSKDVPLHELGHAIDDVFFQYTMQHDSKLEQIILKEKTAFLKAFDIQDAFRVDYYNDPREYWAEAFARFILDGGKLKESAPETYQYIIDKLKETEK